MFEFLFKLKIGQSIRKFGLTIERIGDTHISLGNGYNDIWAIVDFIRAIEADNWFNGILLPEGATDEYDPFADAYGLIA